MTFIMPCIVKNVSGITMLSVLTIVTRSVFVIVPTRYYQNAICDGLCFNKYAHLLLLSLSLFSCASLRNAPTPLFNLMCMFSLLDVVIPLL